MLIYLNGLGNVYSTSLGGKVASSPLYGDSSSHPVTRYLPHMRMMSFLFPSAAESIPSLWLRAPS